MSNLDHAEVDQMFTKLSGMFDHIRNTFVNASELAKKVEELSQRVTELSDQAEAMRQHNINLDEALAHTRAERDAAQAEAADTKAQLNYVIKERDEYKANGEYLQGSYDRVTDSLNKVKDDLYHSNEYAKALEGENEALKQQLEAIKEAHRKIFGDPPVSGALPTPQAVNW